MSQFHQHQPRLPIEDCLDELKRQLINRHEVLLEAPPGAGKTTLVPLALMHEPWLSHRKILMLQPRRIATRSATFRMASLIDEAPGQSIGYRMRLDSKISQRTKVEVITEGILTRMLQQDPSLEGVGLVIFDEFHERSLDSDLALSLCLKGRALFRDETDPLKILVMSATLDSGAIAQLLGDAPIVKSEGRVYPVDVIYGHARQPKENVCDRMVITIKSALAENPISSVLAFLPGQGEINRVHRALSSWLQSQNRKDIHIHALIGNLSLDAQQKAIAALPDKNAGERKLVLATNIAETSLTIEGVDVVVDSGLAREPKFNTATGMSALHTVKISRASSVQRMGRAGRLRPGKCYRLWSAEQQQQLAPHTTAEILQADLAPLALQLLQWGVNDPTELSWLDIPPKGAWQQAMHLLETLTAIESKQGNWILTPHGQSMSALPVHPRLAHLLLCGADINYLETATLLASLLTERDPFSQSNPDISYRLELLTATRPCPAPQQGWLRRTQQLAKQFEARLRRQPKGDNRVNYLLQPDQVLGYLLACAYPDRIARRRHSGGYQLANGRSAHFVERHYLSNSRWLALAEVSSLAGGTGDVIRSASVFDESLFDSVLKGRVSHQTIAEWDKRSGRFIAEEQISIGALIVKRAALDSVPEAAKTAALIQLIQKQGLGLLPWKKEHRQWCARVLLVASIQGNKDWPDVSQQGLLDSLDVWLGPYLGTISSLQGLKQLNLKDILAALLPWDKQQQLNQLTPLRMTVASGSSVAIDYDESPPVLAVKLQELFGYEETPAVVDGKVPLVIHLLSPAGRPLQITQDLAGFWRTSYHDVKKEMKGRYPKHPWPDDPLNAVATKKTKRHLLK